MSPEGIQSSYTPPKEDAIRTNRKARPKNAPMRKTLVPILGERERGILETWWIRNVAGVIKEDFQNWSNLGDFTGPEMSRARSQDHLNRALAASSGLPFTVENIASRALRDFIRLEYEGISQDLTRRYLLNEFVEMLVSTRSVGASRKDGLIKIVTPQLPGF